MLAPFAFRQEATWTRHRTENGSRGSAAPAPRGFRIIHPAHTVPTNLATEPRASLFTSSSINIPVFNIHHVETIVSEADQGAHERQEIDTTDSRETIEREADARQAHDTEAQNDRARTGPAIVEEATNEEIAIDDLVGRDLGPRRNGGCGRHRHETIPRRHRCARAARARSSPVRRSPEAGRGHERTRRAGAYGAARHDDRRTHHARDDRRTGALPCAQGASARQGSRARRVPGT